MQTSLDSTTNKTGNVIQLISIALCLCPGLSLSLPLCSCVPLRHSLPLSLTEADLSQGNGLSDNVVSFSREAGAQWRGEGVSGKDFVFLWMVCFFLLTITPNSHPECSYAWRGMKLCISLFHNEWTTDWFVHFWKFTKLRWVVHVQKHNDIQWNAGDWTVSRVA